MLNLRASRPKSLAGGGPLQRGVARNRGSRGCLAVAQAVAEMRVIGYSRDLGTVEYRMKQLMHASLAVGWTCLLASAPLAGAQPAAREDRLTTPAGLTLYTFDNDVAGSGKSACNPPCSNIFPPYLVEAGASASGDLSVIERADGTKQWAYKGKPLHMWFDDKKPGDAGGDGMNRGIWRIARP